MAGLLVMPELSSSAMVSFLSLDIVPMATGLASMVMFTGSVILKNSNGTVSVLGMNSMKIPLPKYPKMEIASLY